MEHSNISSREPNRNRSFFKRSCICYIVWGCVLFLSACMTAKSQEDNHYKEALTEKQLNDLQEKMDEIYHRVSVIQFMVDNHERMLRDMEKKPAAAGSGAPAFQPEAQPSYSQPMVIPPPQPQPSPPTETVIQEQNIAAAPQTALSQPPEAPPTVLYNKALATYKKGDYAAAATDFDAFLRFYGNHELADNALYWKGESLYAQKDFAGAIRIFKQVIERFPEGSKVPDAMLKAGYAYLSLNDKQNGKQYLNQVVKNYPFSPAGNKAEKMLKQIK